ncbi:TraR/DksA C4-type zinc finger protein [Paenibacillus sp. LHD-117]|uniref:TraR/DksA C4-type zinc finger protein n=1 Tax=Paenibacillus sp. LHD-117 TaxID=3071412 RepID=UPI0027E09E52|nr:TraR/DksA C4-type zinc finger protein [Paenibacillus sp. LHD-117]MDQ6418949.1 TraR/DksA C4-type zinc finger protein [Paenibacillus sp. LHD-117]
MTSLTNAQYSSLRSRLEDEQADILSRLEQNDHYGKSDSMRDESGELSPIDNHPGDMASELYEREKDIALLEQEELHLSRIEAALDAMDKGNYGTCVACGTIIPFERLEAAPDSLYCIDHAPRNNISDNRPIEEVFLQPPFGRTSMDERKSNGFDGEDAWQIVESWGNSDSPAMSENRDVADYDHVGIEAEENDGFVEPIESFLATDITGRHVSVVRNRQYDRYMHANEGDAELQFDDRFEDD